MSAILGDLWPYIAAGAAAVVALVTAFVQGRRSERSRQYRRNLKAAQEMRENEQEASALSDTSLADAISRRR